LQLSLWGGPGAVVDIASLVRLSRLEHLFLCHFYEFEAAQFPEATDMPALMMVDVWNLRASDARILRSRLRGYFRADVRGPKTDAWIAENLDNPFRDWADRGAIGRRAALTYRRALKSARTAKSREAVLAVVRAFVDGFNAIHARRSIDTGDRELVWEAFGRVLDELPRRTARKRIEMEFERTRQF
jgi:hypothetical protein